MKDVGYCWQITVLILLMLLLASNEFLGFRYALTLLQQHTDRNYVNMRLLLGCGLEVVCEVESIS